MKILLVIAWITIIVPEVCFAGDAPESKSPIFNLLTEENPPFQSENPTSKAIEGISIDVIGELFKRSKLEYKIAILPWARGFDQVLRTPNSGIFGTIRTPQREARFEWVGPISKSRWVLFANESADIKIEKFEDAKKYRIGGYINDAKTKFLQSKGVPVEIVNSNDLNVNKLVKGRIDLWIAGDISGRAIAAKLGVHNLKEVFAFGSVVGYLAVNKNTDRPSLSVLRASMKAMNEEDFIEQVVAKKNSDYAKSK